MTLTCHDYISQAYSKWTYSLNVWKLVNTEKRTSYISVTQLFKVLNPWSERSPLTLAALAGRIEMSLSIFYIPGEPKTSLLRLLLILRQCMGIFVRNFTRLLSDQIYTLSPSFITALHGMQTRSCDENSVRPSVCPSVRQTRALWQNGRKICLVFLYDTKDNLS